MEKNFKLVLKKTFRKMVKNEIICNEDLRADDVLYFKSYREARAKRDELRNKYPIGAIFAY